MVEFNWLKKMNENFYWNSSTEALQQTVGLAFSGIGLAKDIYDGKSVKDALLDRLAHIFLYIIHYKYK